MRWLAVLAMILTGFTAPGCEIYDQSLPEKTDAGPDAEPEDAEADATDATADVETD